MTSVQVPAALPLRWDWTFLIRRLQDGIFRKMPCRIAQGNVAMLDAGNVRIEYQDALNLRKHRIREAWNIIVSNPPYICEKEKADMEKNVLEHEPRIALFVPDEDPLKFYRAIAEYASSALKSGGALYFEINPIYEKETREMLLKTWFQRYRNQGRCFRKEENDASCEIDY